MGKRGGKGREARGRQLERTFLKINFLLVWCKGGGKDDVDMKALATELNNPLASWKG